MSKIEVDTIAPQSGTTVTLGEAGDTVTVPTGVTLDTSNSTVTLPDGTVTNAKVNASAAIDYSKLNLTGNIALADLSATGTKDATTFLRGDNTFQTISSDFVRISTSTVSSAHDFVNFDDVFSSTYDNYLVVGKSNITYGNTNIAIRMRAGGTTTTSNIYSRNIGAMFSSTYSDITSQSNMAMSYNDLITNDANYWFYVFSPYLSDQTYVSGMMTSANLHSTHFAGMTNDTTSYDGISVYNVNTGAGDMNTSKVTIYGLKNA